MYTYIYIYIHINIRRSSTYLRKSIPDFSKPSTHLIPTSTIGHLPILRILTCLCRALSLRASAWPCCPTRPYLPRRADLRILGLFWSIFGAKFQSKWNTRKKYPQQHRVEQLIIMQILLLEIPGGAKKNILIVS